MVTQVGLLVDLLLLIYKKILTVLYISGVCGFHSISQARFNSEFPKLFSDVALG